MEYGLWSFRDIRLGRPTECADYDGDVLTQKKLNSFLNLVKNNMGNDLVNFNPRGEQIIKFFQSMDKPEDDKLLREYGVEDDAGNPTSSGLRLVTEMLYKENRQKIIDFIKKVDADQKERNSK